MSPDVIDLQRQHIPAAARTLTQAFRDDPLFRYLYGDLDLYNISKRTLRPSLR